MTGDGFTGEQAEQQSVYEAAGCLSQLGTVSVFRKAVAAKQGVCRRHPSGPKQRPSEPDRCMGCLFWPSATSSKSVLQSWDDVQSPEPNGLGYRSGERGAGTELWHFYFREESWQHSVQLDQTSSCTFLICCFLFIVSLSKIPHAHIFLLKFHYVFGHVQYIQVCLALWLCLMAKPKRQASDRPHASAEHANREDLWKYALCHFLSISLTTSVC